MTDTKLSALTCSDLPKFTEKICWDPLWSGRPAQYFHDAHGAHWYRGWRNGRYDCWRGDGLGWTYHPYPRGHYPDYGYDDYRRVAPPRPDTIIPTLRLLPLCNPMQRRLAAGSR